MKETLKFLKELSSHNTREWFNENKQRYNEARGRVESLTLRLLAALSEIEPECGRMAPADCMYRIYRDTRFSPDKTPYKNHILMVARKASSADSTFIWSPAIVWWPVAYGVRLLLSSKLCVRIFSTMWRSISK